MLNLMRRFASTIWGKILGGILLIGLAGFGISNVLLDLGSATVARVGGEDITTVQFQRAYKQQMDQYAQQTGQVPTDAQAIQLGIPSAVIGRLASDASINQLAARYNIGVSDDKLGEMTRADSSFFGVLGTFDRSIFSQALQQNGVTEAEYFDLQARAAKRQQIALGLFDGTQPPATQLELFNRYRNDTRTIEYFTLNSTSIPDPGTPTDEDLKAYVAAHQADYRTKETRTVAVVYVNPDILASQYQPTEDEIKAEYERTKDQLVKIEKRHIVQVALTTPEAQKIFEDHLAAGSTFPDALHAANLASTDVGLLAKADVTDPALADAAFGLAKIGGFVIIPGVGGKRAVGVSEIQPGGQISYEDAKADIAKRLGADKAKNAYADLQDQIESLRAALKPLKEIADRFKLPIEFINVTQDGEALSAVPGLAEADRSKLANAIFAATAGKLSPAVSYGANANAWFDLSKVEPARDQTLDEVRAAATTAWTAAKTDEAIKAEVTSIMKDLDGGKTFQDVAAARSQFATVSTPFTRAGDGSKVLNAQVATNVFSSPPDGHGWVVDGDGEYLVYHVTDVTAPGGAIDSKISDFLVNSDRDTLYAEFISGLRDEAGIKINQQALSSLLNLDQTAQ